MAPRRVTRAQEGATPDAAVPTSTRARALAGGTARSFAAAAARYWGAVYPRVQVELDCWRRRVLAIPDEQLRSAALAALAKRSNVEGAAAFATFTPPARTNAVIIATSAFQTAYDYLDVLTERPRPDAVRDSLVLHEALCVALQPEAELPRFYALHGEGAGNDGGYLPAMVQTCRAALAHLPSYPLVEAAALRAASRVARFQGFNCGEMQGDGVALASWAQRIAPADGGLAWWEVAASAGSSLGVLALIAAAADPRLSPAVVRAIEDAYHPWIGALHSLLDQLADVAEDERTGQRNLLACYADSAEAAHSFGRLAARAKRCAERLASLTGRREHELLLAAMAGSYLSLRETERTAGAARAAVLVELGPLASASIAVFKAKRLAGGR
jgi:tetraprenyl-beta-curcumene synthase